jgi:hypothetical protein
LSRDAPVREKTSRSAQVKRAACRKVALRIMRALSFFLPLPHFG